MSIPIYTFSSGSLDLWNVYMISGYLYVQYDINKHDFKDNSLPLYCVYSNNMLQACEMFKIFFSRIVACSDFEKLSELFKICPERKIFGHKSVGETDSGVKVCRYSFFSSEEHFHNFRKMLLVEKVHES